MSKEVKTRAAGKFLDVLTLGLAQNAFDQWLEENDKQREGQSLVKAGEMMSYRFFASLDWSDANLIQPLLDRSDAARIKQIWLRGKVKIRGSKTQKFKRMSEVLAEVFTWLRKRPATLRLFFTGRELQGVFRICKALEEESPQDVISILCSSVTLGGIRAPVAWIRKVAKFMDVEPSEEEMEVADTESALIVGDQIHETQMLIDAEGSTPRGVQAMIAKDQLEEQVDKIAKTSRKPKKIKEAVTLDVAKKSLGSQTSDLTPEQQRAVLAMGKSLIAAGAGSGKTHTLGYKIKHLVDQGYNPDQILATSFTRKASFEIKDRVKSKFGVTGDYIGRTTDSITWGIVSEFSPRDRPAMGNLNQSGYLARVARHQITLKPDHGSYQGGGGRGWGGRRRYAEEEEGKKKPKKPPSPYWKQAAGMWFNLATEPVSDDGKRLTVGQLLLRANSNQYASIPWQQVRDSSHPGTEQYFVAAFMAAYEWLKSNCPVRGPCMDHVDILTKARDIVRDNPKARSALQTRFKAVIVDEAQDLNQAQSELFSMLSGKADVECYIGDDKQSIYGFRSAKPEIFVGRSKDDFDVIPMTMNFRSGAAIVEAANRLITYNEDRQIPMVCRADEAKGRGEIQTITPRTQEEGAMLVVKQIVSAVESGESPKSFGIVVRNNVEADDYVMGLLSNGIPVETKVKYFDKPPVKRMLEWLRLGTRVGTRKQLDDALFTAHSVPGFYLGKEFVSSLKDAARSYNGPLVDYFLANPQVGYKRNTTQNAIAYAKAIESLRNHRDIADMIDAVLSLNGTVVSKSGKTSFLDKLVEELGNSVPVGDDAVDLEDEEEQTDTLVDRAKAPLNLLLGLSGKLTSPQDYFGFIDQMEALYKQKSTDDPETKVPAVFVATCHQWKGLEADTVFVNMAGGVWPNFRSQDAFDKGDVTALDEERRLAYVGITRGKKNVTVVSPQNNIYGKSAGVPIFVQEACIPVESADVLDSSLGPVEETMRSKSASRNSKIARISKKALDLDPKSGVFVDFLLESLEGDPTDSLDALFDEMEAAGDLTFGEDDEQVDPDQIEWDE